MSENSPRIPWTLPALGIGIAAAVGVVSVAFGPDGNTGRIAGPLVLAAFWGYVELAIARGGADRPETEAIYNWHRVVFTIIGLFLATRIGLALAIEAGMLDKSGVPIAWRYLGITKGMMLAIWGNYLPKLLSPWGPEDEPFDWQRVHRAAGWLASLGGICVVIVWLILPLEAAVSGSRSIFRTVGVLAVGGKLLSLATHRRGASRSPV